MERLLGQEPYGQELLMLEHPEYESSTHFTLD